MSTSAEIGRWPLRSRRCFIHCGVSAFAFRPRITRPEKRPHKSAALIFTGSFSSSVTATGLDTGALSGVPVNADTSRATPSTDRQSARLGVSLIVNFRSFSWKWSRKFWPTCAVSASSSRPPWSSDSFSSRAEHSIPCDSTPRSLPTLISNGLPSSPGGSLAPASAHGTFMPTRTFGAPQTMLSNVPVPAST